MLSKLFGEKSKPESLKVAVEPTAAEVSVRLQNTFASEEYKPPVLPAVALELLELSHRADIEVAKIVSTLEKDPVLAARVFKRSQSAFFGPSGNITSLKQAVTRLGLNSVRSLVLEAALNMKVFRAEHYATALDRVRIHSMAIAQISKLVASASTLDPEAGFLTGLLHDIGIAASLLVLGEGTRATVRPKLTPGLWSTIHKVHADASARIATLWTLPPVVAIVLKAHHQGTVTGVPHPYASVICVAEHLAVDLNYHFVPPEMDPEHAATIDGTSTQALQSALKTLKIDEDKLQNLRTQMTTPAWQGNLKEAM